MIKHRIRRTPAVKSPRCGLAGPRSMSTSDDLNSPPRAKLRCLARGNLILLPFMLLVLVMGGLLSNPNPFYAGKKAGPESTHVVDINHASVEELATLPGIGKITARRIVAFREKNGPFRRLEDLLIVRGISEKRLKQIFSRISLGSDPGKPEKTK
jgi:competence ComEA-like helix-hairpin-helix protein